MDINKAFDRIVATDVWIFVAAIFLLAAIVSDSLLQSAHSYWYVLPVLFVLYSPTLIFHLFKAKLKQIFGRKYFIAWLFVFVAYPVIITFLREVSNTSSLAFLNSQIIGVSGIVLGITEVVLNLQKSISARTKRIQWIRHIDLDKIVGAVGVFIILILSALATSNIHFGPFDGQLFNDDVRLSIVLNHPFSMIFNMVQMTIVIGILYGFYWFNRHYLIGRVLKQKGLLHFICSVIAVIAVAYPIGSALIAHLPLSQNYMSLLPNNSFNYLQPENAMVPFTIIAMSTPVIIVLEWFGQTHRITALAKEKAEKELDFLKQQINPHFFFNTLNNLYALSLQKSHQTPEVVMQLADLMRYVIYKGKEDYVTIGEELEYLQDYIQLQRLRQHQKLAFSFEDEISDHSIEIPPLLLIVLIENAFKHGVEACEESCFIRARIYNEGDNIFFEVENSHEENEQGKPGIGIDNLRRRLDLLYPEQYDLAFHAEPRIFRANLNLYAA